MLKNLFFALFLKFYVYLGSLKIGERVSLP